jgi:hypothetical protein
MDGCVQIIAKESCCQQEIHIVLGLISVIVQVNVNPGTARAHWVIVEIESSHIVVVQRIG